MLLHVDIKEKKNMDAHARVYVCVSCVRMRKNSDK